MEKRQPWSSSLKKEDYERIWEKNKGSWLRSSSSKEENQKNEQVKAIINYLNFMFAFFIVRF